MTRPRLPPPPIRWRCCGWCCFLLVPRTTRTRASPPRSGLRSPPGCRAPQECGIALRCGFFFTLWLRHSLSARMSWGKSSARPSRVFGWHHWPRRLLPSSFGTKCSPASRERKPRVRLRVKSERFTIHGPTGALDLPARLQGFRPQATPARLDAEPKVDPPTPPH